jgi:DNA repair exonuclease SbcCD ATPase subunit
MNELKDIEEEYQKFVDMKNKFEHDKHKVATAKASVETVKSKLETVQNDLKYTEQGIELYYKSKDIIEKNNEIESEIEELQEEKSDINERIESLDSDKLKLHGEIEIFKMKINSINDDIETAQKNEDKLAAYQYYLEAVGKNGVPYELLEKAIPTIQGEVNAILEQIVDFGIQFELDGKNVSAMIVYEDKAWALELTSGAERFMSGLAIRMALINVSSLPRPNFMVIDEGWSALDANNIVATNNLMQYLKNQFDFSIIISHDEKMRDMVDSSLTVEKKNGFSSINY